MEDGGYSANMRKLVIPAERNREADLSALTEAVLADMKTAKIGSENLGQYDISSKISLVRALETISYPHDPNNEKKQRVYVEDLLREVPEYIQRKLAEKKGKVLADRKL